MQRLSHGTPEDSDQSRKSDEELDAWARSLRARWDAEDADQ